MRTGFIARQKLEEFPCLFLRRPCDPEVPLGARIEEAASHFLKWDVFADALEPEPDAADIAGNGDEGDVIALSDGNPESGSGTGDERSVIRVAAEEVIAKEGGRELSRAVAGDGAGVGTPPRLIHAGAPDVELVNR